MRITYDTRADAMYIQLREGEFARNKEVEEGVILDLGTEGELLGIELLEASSRVAWSEIAKVVIEMPLHLAAPEPLLRAA
jgi:uncharacterized protein YuzE